MIHDLSTQKGRNSLANALSIKEQPKEKVKLLMGHFSFLDEKNDGEFKAIIHVINAVFEYDTEDEANEAGENMLSDYESYLVPTSYGGEIDLSELEMIGNTLD